MATIYYADGTQREMTPRNGTDFQWEELSEIVGGYIELLETLDGRAMVINEEGKLLELPRNEQATKLVRLATPHDLAFMKAILGDAFIVVSADPNPIRDDAPEDYIAGDVLVCLKSEVR